VILVLLSSARCRFPWHHLTSGAGPGCRSLVRGPAWSSAHPIPLMSSAPFRLIELGIDLGDHWRRMPLHGHAPSSNPDRVACPSSKLSTVSQTRPATSHSIGTPKSAARPRRWRSSVAESVTVTSGIPAIASFLSEMWARLRASESTDQAKSTPGQHEGNRISLSSWRSCDSNFGSRET
jgi:hypothetical protein